MQTLTLPNQTSYLVMMYPPLVLLDIAEAIEDYAPDAAVLQVQTAADALATLDKLASVSMAILRMSPTSALAQGLTKKVRGLGGQVVFYGNAAELAGADPNWTILKSPFTTNSLMAILRLQRKASSRALCAEAMPDAEPGTPQELSVDRRQLPTALSILREILS